MLKLRGYQQRALEIVAGLPKPARLFLAWDMGAGKTLAAIAIARTFKRHRVLVVCPAIVRENWVRELQRHWPDVNVGNVTHGRNRKLPVAASAVRDASYKAEVQVVSYDLLGECSKGGWDMIVVDEFHNLRSCTSKQSKAVRAVFSANPAAWAVGLSGTPIPNEASQLWNPVDTFFPGRWGRQSKKGFVPWAWANRYCKKEASDYGSGQRFYGLREDRRAELEAKFGEVSQRVVQADFAQYLPDLFVEALHVDARPDPVKLATQWYAGIKDQVPHVGIYCHLRETAYKISQALGGVVITGALSAGARDQQLRVLREAPSSLVIGTTHALAVGVSLSFQKAALVVEWTTAMDDVTQFIGRFARQDSTCDAPTRVQFVVGPDDGSRAETLARRIEESQSVVGASRPDQAAASVFAPVEMGDDAFEAELERLAAQQDKRANLWGASEDDDDED